MSQTVLHPGGVARHRRACIRGRMGLDLKGVTMRTRVGGPRGGLTRSANLSPQTHDPDPTP